MSRPVIWLAVPHYGEVCADFLNSIINAGGDCGVNVNASCSSALTYNFNQLWSGALNNRKELGITHFAMLHSDVAPEPGWLGKLLALFQRADCDILSCVIPIKDQRGVTTTAIGRRGTIEVHRRLTVREARRLPEIFDVKDAGYPDRDLLINTGCWICDFTQPWVEEFPGFTIVDGIQKNPATGKYEARFFSEDWYFSVWAAQKGLRVKATNAIKIGHHGRAVYRNDCDWGLEADPSDSAQPTRLDEVMPAMTEGKPAAPAKADASKPVEKSREIVVVRCLEDRKWLHGWLDDILVKHGPNLTYRIYDKGPGGDTPNIGHLDAGYLLHITKNYNALADWTIFTQADPEPHMQGAPFAALLDPQPNMLVPCIVPCKEWDETGRLHWHKFPEPWKRRYEVGAIHPARLSLREWFKEYLQLDIDPLGGLAYHPGAIFAVSRESIQAKPLMLYERLLESLMESQHAEPEESHYMERAWAYLLGGGGVMTLKQPAAAGVA